MKNLKRNISSSARPIASKLGRVVIEGKGASPIKPHDHKIWWQHENLKSKIENCPVVGKENI